MAKNRKTQIGATGKPKDPTSTDLEASNSRNKKAISEVNGVQFPERTRYRIQDYTIPCTREQAKLVTEFSSDVVDDNDFMCSFEAQLRACVKRKLKSHEYLIVSPSAQALGLPEAGSRPLVMRQYVVRKSIEIHDISLRKLASLPELLRKYVLGAESTTFPNSIGYIVPETDGQNDQILVAVHLDVKKRRAQVDDLASIHGRTNLSGFIENVARRNKCIYANERTQPWCDSLRNELSNKAAAIIQAALSCDSAEDSRKICHDVINRMDAEEILKYVKEIRIFVIGQLSGNGSGKGPFGSYEDCVARIQEIAPLAGDAGVKALEELDKIDAMWTAAGNMSATKKTHAEMPLPKKSSKCHPDS